MSAREEILNRIRRAIDDVGSADPAQDVPVDWVYGRPTELPDVLERFAERVADYRAEVIHCSNNEVAARIVATLNANGANRIVVPPGLNSSWQQEIRKAELEVVVDAGPGALDARGLDAIDAVVTAAAVGIAETGTVVLDHRVDQGRRALTLVPDLHICVVRADQVVSDVPEGVSRLAESVTEGFPLTWISGPSATSDIELDRVEGVHGPRNLVVLIAS